MKKTVLTAALAMALSAGAANASTGNNFTMLDPGLALTGGTNDVVFTWDGTLNTAVAGATSNATIASDEAFFSQTWVAHTVTLYGAGTYDIYPGCGIADAACGVRSAGNEFYRMTVGAGQIGAHMLFNWGGSNNIDVVVLWNPNEVFAPSSLWTTGDTGAVGDNAAFPPSADYVGPDNIANNPWALMSIDADGDGGNGTRMIDGPFQRFSANFNIRALDGQTLPTGALDGSVTVIPVPAAVWLFGSGLIGLVGVARRKKSA